MIFYTACVDLNIENADSRHVMEVCQAWARDGHRVCLFVPKIGKTRDLPGVLVKAVSTPSQSVFANYFLFYFLVIPHLLSMARRARPRMLYSRFLATELCLALVARLAGWPYVVEYNGAIGEELRLKRRPSGVIRMVDWLERACLGLASRVVAVTAGLKDYLTQRQGLDPGKIMVVTNGVNLDLCRPLDPAQCRRELGLDPHGPYLLFVGSLQAWHGAERLVGVAETLAAQGRPAHLLIVGSGPGEQDLRRRVAASPQRERITLTGKVDFHLVPHYIGAATLCLAPYPDTIVGRHGLAPLKIREFMACGRPVVTTAVGGLEILMAESGGGLAARTNGEEGMARVVARLLDDPDLRERMGRAGRAYAVAHLGWPAKAREILSGLGWEEA